MTGSRWARTDGARGDDYDARWRTMEEAGQSIHGEADFVADLAPNRVLDAGCGTGRVAIELRRRGVETVGVDLDVAMLETARRNDPDGDWRQADLTALDLTDEEPFDVVVAAGNVMIFLAPGTEATVVERLSGHLGPGGRMVAGFQLGRDLSLDDYDRHCAGAGLVLAERWSTWERDPWRAGGGYAVSVHRRR